MLAYKKNYLQSIVFLVSNGRVEKNLKPLQLKVIKVTSDSSKIVFSYNKKSLVGAIV